MNDPRPIDIGTLEMEVLEEFQNSEFRVEEEGREAIVLTLLEVTATPDHRPEGQKEGRAPFSAVFGSPVVALPQGTYCLRHESLGQMTVFISPFEAYHEGHKLEAVFS